jgi:DNA segregation ATPase FtsK/SpoIIIE, S-DNA-T family
VFSEGTPLGISFAVTGDRPGAVPTRLSSAVATRLVLRLADPGDHAALGLRPRELPRFVEGRAVEADTRRVLQLARPAATTDVAERARRRWGEGTVAPVDALPTAVPVSDLPTGKVDGGRLWLPLGLGDEELEPCGLELHPGDHATVVGPARSGRSTALATIADVVRRTDPDAIVVGVCRPGSPLHGREGLDASGPPDALDTVLAAAVTDDRRWVVLVDDAPGFEDADGSLLALIGARDDLHVIGSARTDELRGDYGQWHRRLRRSRTGLLLQPDLPGDGELLGARLPRRVPVPLRSPGRGFLVSAGAAELLQVAAPS